MAYNISGNRVRMPEDELADINEEPRNESTTHDIPVHHHPVTHIEAGKEETKPATSFVQPQATQASAQEPAPKVNPGMLVLQWLVYAFWGWTAVAVSWLAAMVVTFLFHADGVGDALGEPVAYALASTLVLFVISLISDIFYSKREPLHKTGASMVIMVIHAVIFALFGIGWLIAAVFGGVQLLIGEADSTSGALSLIVTAALVFLVYGVTLLRTLRPVARKLLPRLYWIFMAIVVVVLIIVAAVGPAAQVRLAKADEALVDGLPDVSSAINTYTKRNDKLPASLDDIKSSLRSSALKIVDENKVKYTAKEKLGDPTPASSGATSEDSKAVPPIYEISDAPVYHYELCVTYAAESKYYNDDYKRYDYASDTNYDITPSTYRHPAGEVCYDLQTDYNYYYAQ